MRVFTGDKLGKVHVLRIDAGEYLLESIEEFIKAKNINNAVVISAIGTLDYCVMHMVTTTGFPPQEYFRKWDDEPLEISSIDGIIADGSAHFHMTVSDEKIACAGHLEPGCRILYLCEVVIAEMDGFNFRREKNERNINQLVDKK